MLSSLLASTRHGEWKAEVTFAIVVGVIYVLCVHNAPELFERVSIPYATTAEYLREHSLRYVAASSAVPIVPLLLMVVGRWRLHLRPFWRHVWRDPLSVCGLLFGATILVSILLNIFHVWVWVWRWNAPAYSFFEFLQNNGRWLEVGMLFISYGFIRPLLEEYIFRWGLLRGLQIWTDSSTIAVVGSSFAFALMHIPWRPSLSVYQIWHACAVFVFSLMLGAVTLRRDGSIGCAVSVHASRNLIELTMFFVR